MVNIIINGKKIEVEEGYTVLQACEMAGIEIPRFCYHERLKIAGNCRMCLVDIEKSPKPVASCSMPVAEGMNITTDSPKVQKYRQSVMEFLLINHPLDCPVCDQGGECDLQDQAFKYGKNVSSYKESKRAVKDKNMGPLVQTHMTRCIHCTRCVRFCTDIAGIQEMGTVGRGEHMEVVTYLEKAISSELSGNLVDLCPVGALTSKPYQFKYRIWELRKTKSVDIFDAVGSNIRIDSRGLEIMRILPEVNEHINQEWISDKARFAFDGLKYQRLETPLIRKGSELKQATWDEALNLLVSEIKKVDPSDVGVVCGNIVDCESAYLLKKLFNSIGCENVVSTSKQQYDTSARANYLFNTTISGIDKSDFCLMIGADVRFNAPIIASRIGQNVRERGLRVARIGTQDNQTFKTLELGQNPQILEEILNGRHEIGKLLEKTSNPMMIIGDGVLERDDAADILAVAHKICEKYAFIKEGWNGFNILHNEANSVGLLDLSFGGNNIDNKKLIYLLNADDFDSVNTKDAFVVYQGHHGDSGANRADLILPGCAYTEKDGIYVNLEGRPQYARQVVKPLAQAKDDRVILLELAKKLAVSWKFKNLKDVRKEMEQKSSVFEHMNEIISNSFIFLPLSNKLKDIPIEKRVKNYYMDNVIARVSPTMLECTKSIVK